MVYGIFDSSGNALGFWDTKEEAEEALAAIIEADPASEDECVIIDFPDPPEEGSK